MKTMSISDMHGNLPMPDEFDGADLVLIAGDICPDICPGGKPKQQLHWLGTEFKQWLKSIDAPVFGVAGNHDWPFFGQEYPFLKKEVLGLNLPWTYLEDSGVEFEGLKIWGTPWQREFYDWAFNLREHELAEKWSLIPDDTDVLICHSPPKGFGDYVFVDQIEVGSLSLLKRIEDIHPKLVVFGHVHCGHGHWDYDGIQLANVTVVNEQYQMVYPPFEFDLI